MPDTNDEILETISAVREDYQERDDTVDRIYDKYMVKSTRTVNSEWERSIILPMLSEAANDTQAALESAKMRVRCSSRRLDETPDVGEYLSSVELWLYGLVYTNGLRCGEDLRHKIENYRWLEGAAVARVTWGDGPDIDIIPWRSCYMPSPTMSDPNCFFTVIPVTVFDLEREFKVLTREYKDMTLAEKRRKECHKIDYWEIREDGQVWNAVLVGNTTNKRPAEYVIDPRPMEGYYSVPFAVIPYNPRGKTDPLMFALPAPYVYLDLIDDVEEMLGKERFRVDRALNMPIFLELGEGAQPIDMTYGPNKVVPVRNAKVQMPQLPPQVVSDKMLSALMGVLSNMGLPKVSSPYLSGESASVQANLGQVRLTTPAQQLEFGMTRIFEMSLALAQVFGGGNLPTVTIPPMGSRGFALSEIAEGAMGKAFTKPMMFGADDIIIHVSVQPELPGDDMRKAALMGQMKASGLMFDDKFIMQAGGIEQPEVPIKGWYRQNILNMVLPATIMQYLQEQGMPIPQNVMEGGGAQRGIPSPPNMGVPPGGVGGNASGQQGMGEGGGPGAAGAGQPPGIAGGYPA